MRKQLVIGVILFLFCLTALGLMAISCSKPEDQPTVTPVVTEGPTDTPTDTPTVTPTDTPTLTPTCTPTFTPTPTPTYTVSDLETRTARWDNDIPFVMIDPGHGGSDPGACENEDTDDIIKESDINLAIGLKVAEKLLDMGIQVVMTRSTNALNPAYDVSSYKSNYPKASTTQRYNYFRRDFSNNTDVDIFISIHQNSVEENTNAFKGVEVWRTKVYNAASADLATAVFDAIEEKIGYGRWVIGDVSDDYAAKNLAVLRENYKPSILVECGYMSHPDELKLLVSSEYQDKYADGIVEGIITFLKGQGNYEKFFDEE